MLIFPRPFIRLLDGRHRNADGSPSSFAEVALLPSEIACLLPSTASVIRLETEYAKKIVNRHKLTFRDLSNIDRIWKNSFAFREKPNYLTLMSDLSGDGRPYVLVLKAIPSKGEVWISTFHRSNPQQMKSKLRKAKDRGYLFREPDRDFDE